MQFRHEVLDPETPAEKLTVCLTGDLTGNGRPDVVVGAKEGDPTLFWYENPGWERHDISTTPGIEAGGALVDLTGDGGLDLVVGQTWNRWEAYWFERPADPRDPWERHLITDLFRMYHDQAVGDVDGDGEPEVLFASQKSRVLFYYDVPDDPRRGPWPDDCLHVVATDVHVEGLQVADVDGDGENEIVAGTSVFRREDGRWRRESVDDGWEETRVVTADLNGDGALDLVVSEGETPFLSGDRPARLAWFAGPDWERTVLREDLFCPHSLQVADFDGDGRPDVYVGEQGLGEHDEEARHLVFRNRGDGTFEEHLIDAGVHTHEAKAVDLDGDGRPDVVGKPYEPGTRVDVWWNETG